MTINRSDLNPSGVPCRPDSTGPQRLEVTARANESVPTQLLPLSRPMPARGSPLPPPDIFVATGVTFVDRAIRGQLAGECNGLLVEPGPDENTLCLQLTASNAKMFDRSYREPPGRRKLSVLFTFGTPKTIVMTRLLANTASIPYAKLSQVLGQAKFDSELLLAPDQDKLWAAAKLDAAERNKLKTALHLIEHAVAVVDMTSVKEPSGDHRGLADEIASELHRLSKQSDADIGAVHIDSAGAMCERHMLANSISRGNLRIVLDAAGDQLRRVIACPFKCPVWVTHHLAAARSTRPCVMLRQHFEGLGSKSFAENMAVCGCLGPSDPATGCMLLNWSKARHETAADQWAVLRVDYDFCRLLDVSHRFVPDQVGKTFIERPVR